MTSSAALRILDARYQSMPPVAAMQLRVADYDQTSLRLQAPLAQHVNDKGCAFGGSLASVMTLACWGLAWLQLHQAGLDADIFVADSEVRYFAPLYSDLDVTATLAADADWRSFIAALRKQGRARIALAAAAWLPASTADLGQNPAAARSGSRYVAVLKR